MRVEIRPIERKKWHGKTGKESFTRPKTIEALVNANSMKYNTGLSEEDKKLLKEKGISYDISEEYTGEAHPFWESKTAQIKLENQTMLLYPKQNVLDFIKVRICRASKFVANSLQEWEEGKWPEATHVIFDEAAEVEMKASKSSLKRRAIVELAKLGKERKVQLVMVLSGKDVKGKSDDYLEVALDDIVEGRIPNVSAKDVLEHINMDAEEIAIHALVLECLMKNVLTKKGHRIEYKGSNLGGDEIEVVHYLAQDKNQDLRLRLTAEVNN